VKIQLFEHELEPVGLVEKERLFCAFSNLWLNRTHTCPHIFPETEAEVWILGMLLCWILLRAPCAETHTHCFSPDLSLNASSLCSLSHIVCLLSGRLSSLSLLSKTLNW